jgi:predicted unusual protein kinase regulating ubiquinone biosynthesis (AarF/ABC1/UbiB family)
MSDDKIPEGKIERGGLAAKTIAKLGVKHLGHMSKKVFTSKLNQEELQKKHEEDLGKIIFGALSQLRGTALKVSQVLSLEPDLFPESIRLQLAKACHQVIPLNRALIRKVFLAEFNQTPEKKYTSFNANAFAAASLGQVHRAKSLQGDELAVKIQYPGIAASIESDIRVLRTMMLTIAEVSNFLPKKELLNFVVDEIENALKDEVDYNLEADSTEWFKKSIELEDIVVPSVYREGSGKRVISFEFIDGLHLNEWLQTNPSQQEKDHYGQLLFDFFWYSITKLNRIHADPHPGNFLFIKNGKIALLDFGCTSTLEDKFSDKVVNLFSIRHTDSNYRSLVVEGFKKLDFFGADFTMDDFNSMNSDFLINQQKWLTTPYQSKSFKFDNNYKIPPHKFKDHKELNKKVDGLARNQVYFDRSYMGLIQILKKLEAQVECVIK